MILSSKEGMKSVRGLTKMGGCIVEEMSVISDISAILKVLDGCMKSVVVEKDNVELWGIIVCSPCLRCDVFLINLDVFFLVFVVFPRGERDFVDILEILFYYYAVCRADLKTLAVDGLFSLCWYFLDFVLGMILC